MNSQPTPRLAFIQQLSQNRPRAMAWVQGNASHPQISGLVKFYDAPYGGTLVEAEIFGLPKDAPSGTFFGMHIHQYGDCSDQFQHTGDHFNPTGMMHPQHAGDLPPLLGNQGYAWTAFFDRRFRISDILNRSVVIHSQRDDFTTQPAGDSGTKIACGVIRAV